METIFTTRKALPPQKNKKRFDAKDCTYAIADGPYTTIHSPINKPLIIAVTLKSIEKQLISNDDFIRPSRSVIINLNHVGSYEIKNNKTGQIILTNGIKISVSRRRAKDTLESILNFFQGKCMR